MTNIFPISLAVALGWDSESWLAVGLGPTVPWTWSCRDRSGDSHSAGARLLALWLRSLAEHGGPRAPAAPVHHEAWPWPGPGAAEVGVPQRLPGSTWVLGRGLGLPARQPGKRDLRFAQPKAGPGKRGVSSGCIRCPAPWRSAVGGTHWVGTQPLQPALGPARRGRPARALESGLRGAALVAPSRRGLWPRAAVQWGQASVPPTLSSLPPGSGHASPAHSAAGVCHRLLPARSPDPRRRSGSAELNRLFPGGAPGGSKPSRPELIELFGLLPDLRGLAMLEEGEK